MVFSSAFVWKCTNMCKHRFGAQCFRIHRFVTAPMIHICSTYYSIEATKHLELILTC